MPYFHERKWCCDKCAKEYDDRSAAVACEDQDKAQERDLFGE